jgi:hypothetical protein
MGIHNLLLIFSVPATAGRERLVSLLEKSKIQLEFQNFSGLYKRFSNSRREDLNAELLMGAHAVSTLHAAEIQELIKKAASEIEGSEILLLAWDEHISLLPQLTIPHPSLIQDQLVLLCAAEACGEFVHPILGKNLKNLLQGVSQSPLAEFVSQSHFLGWSA